MPAYLSFIVLTLGVLCSVGCRQAVESVSSKNPDMDLSRMDALIAECSVCHGVSEAQRGPILNGMES
ncbi:MAG: hypothetical protein VX821_03575, partial [Verrucomicrobiota bacterium]|nr:hypothetical protein [Verrucomicrobiota bacterium]